MRPTKTFVFSLIGLLQGQLLWWLGDSAHTGWTTAEPVLYRALWWSGIAIPLVLYLSADAGMSLRRRAVLVSLLALGYALCGACEGWSSQPPPGLKVDIGYDAVSSSCIPAAAMLGFMLIALASGWDNERRRWRYERLFEIAWRNMLLLPTACLLVGVSWVVLFAGAELMDIIGIHTLKTVFSWPRFDCSYTGLVTGIAFASAIDRASLLVNLRRFVLSLKAWLLPLLLGFAVLWIAVLPFTGLGLLFQTHAATRILIGFCLLGIQFLNCAWQSGEEAPPYPPAIARLLGYSWPALNVVAVVALIALGLRVDQYGWTAARIWAAVIGVHVLAHIAGYSLVGLRRRDAGWLPGVGPTNIAVALSFCLSLLLLLSPLADPVRLGVAAQVARLRAGTPGADLDYLRYRSGRWGLLALQELASGHDALASQAQVALRQSGGLPMYGRAGLHPGQAAPTVVLTAPLTVLGTDQPDAALHSYLANPDPGDIASAICRNNGARCAVWLHDIDSDGHPDALLIAEMGNSAYPTISILASDGSRWWLVGHAEMPLRILAWQDLIARGQISFAPSRWPDIVINGKRHQIVEQGRRQGL